MLQTKKDQSEGAASARTTEGGNVPLEQMVTVALEGQPHGLHLLLNIFGRLCSGANEDALAECDCSSHAQLRLRGRLHTCLHEWKKKMKHCS